MVTAFLLAIFFQQPVSAAPSVTPSPQRILDSAIAIVRRHSLWRDTVSWEVVEPRVRVIAANAATVVEVYPAIRSLLTSLGDRHSFFVPPDASRAFRAGGSQNQRPEIRTMADSIGYISVPGYFGIDTTAMRKYVADVYDAITAALPSTKCRWIVDLRNNGGGNMWPMLGGLRPFLGEAVLGSFVSATGGGRLWRARDAIDVRLTPALAALDSTYVAVLTGPRTASSGEAVAISFVGRARTRSFGQPTVGLTTANDTFALPDGSMLVLTVSVEADRNGKRYGGKVEPDEVVISRVGDDPELSRAAGWLNVQRGCRGDRAP